MMFLLHIFSTKFATFKFWPFQSDKYLYEADYVLLADKQWLSDYALEYYIKNLQSKYPDRKLDIFIFDTDCNRDFKKTTFTGREFTTILTKLNVNVFTMDYLIIPLNHSGHWYLALIRNPFFALCNMSL